MNSKVLEKMYASVVERCKTQDLHTGEPLVLQEENCREAKQQQQQQQDVQVHSMTNGFWLDESMIFFSLAYTRV